MGEGEGEGVGVGVMIGLVTGAQAGFCLVREVS